MDTQISISNIIFSLNKCPIAGGNIEEILKALYNAKDELNKALQSMDEITVKGKEPMNVLLGCILAIEKIIGDKGE